MNKFIEATVDSVLNYVRDSVVFLDDASAECFHWNDGLTKLLDAGALDVRDIKHNKECLESEQKCVFFISSPIQGAVMKFIQRIIKNSDFMECIIISSLSSDVNQFISRNPKSNVFEEVTQQMKTWMKNEFAIIDILHFPLFMINMAPDVFISPVHNNTFPMLPSDVARLQAFLHSQGDKRTFDHLGDIDMAFLPHNMQSKIKMLASSLNSMFKSMDTHEDCYAVGHFSRLLATELANMPDAKARRKLASSRASVVFVDRTLDLVATTTHTPDNGVLGTVYEILPRLKNHHNDIEINMEHVLAKGNRSGTTVFPGCLAHPNDNMAQDALDTFVMKTKKGCLSYLCDKLNELLKEHGIVDENDGVSEKPTVERLKSILEKFRERSLLEKYISLLQCVVGFVNAFTDGEIDHVEELLSTEKVILAELGEERCDPLSLLLQLISDEDNKLFTVVDVIMLCLFVYSAGVEEGNDAWFEKEEKLKEALIDILRDGKNKEDMLFLIGDLDASERQIRTCVSEFFERLHGISHARANLTQLKTLLQKDEFGIVKYNPIVNQILELIFDPKRADLLDIEFCSHGLKDFLKSGFGLFGLSVSKPRPDDHPVVIIFVVGGVTWYEVKSIRECVSKLNITKKVIIGSTRILTPSDTLEQVICSENLFVDVDV